MPRYLVYDTETDADTACTLIDNRGRPLYAAAGYEIREDGAVIGKDGEGDSDPRGVLEHWAVPRRRADGKWVVAHPEANPMRDYVVGPGLTVLDVIMAGLVAPVEEWAPEWWPPVVE